MRAHQIDVAGSGFTVLDRIYEGATRIVEEMGGSCANVLWSLAMLHHRVVPVLSLGADDVGQHLRQSFRDAGAETGYIRMHADARTPMLAQFVDRSAGRHHFSSVCPETHLRFPRYRAIGRSESAAASNVFVHCAVFYSDRLSDGIVDAMASVSANGGIVLFEPSEMADGDELFHRALPYISVIKCSEERIADLGGEIEGRDPIRVVTAGASGLHVSVGGRRIHLSAYSTDSVLDTSGAGDMVSVGLIDHLLAVGADRTTLSLETAVVGLRAGQRLAAANCGYIGARGIFRQSGSIAARKALDA